jgi:hypothetical protein
MNAARSVADAEVPERPEEVSVDEAVDQHRSDVEAHSARLYMTIIV